MVQNPVYNTFRYALEDSSGNFLNEKVDFYADSITSKFFDHGTLAAEAAVVLNLWMITVNKLYEGVHGCKMQMNNTSLPNNAMHFFDEAAAYWIGQEQVTGSASRGHTMYALSEEMGTRFGQDDSDQTEVNQKILMFFNEAKDQMTFPNACSENSSTHENLKHIVDEMVSVMTIPLLQGLIHNLFKKDLAAVDVYAGAFIPMIAGCNPNTFKMLEKELLSGDFSVSKEKHVLDIIQSSYSCLGFTCDDVGKYFEEGLYECTDQTSTTPIAGYVPSTDVREVRF